MSQMQTNITHSITIILIAATAVVVLYCPLPSSLLVSLPAPSSFLLSDRSHLAHSFVRRVFTLCRHTCSVRSTWHQFSARSHLAPFFCSFSRGAYFCFSLLLSDRSQRGFLGCRARRRRARPQCPLPRRQSSAPSQNNGSWCLITGARGQISSKNCSGWLSNGDDLA